MIVDSLKMCDDMMMFDDVVDGDVREVVDDNDDFVDTDVVGHDDGDVDDDVDDLQLVHDNCFGSVVSFDGILLIVLL
jgi:hypothetical protein